MNKLEFIEADGPGKWNHYDRPDYYILYVVYNNRLLEKIHSHTDYEQGRNSVLVKQKWKKKSDKQIQEAWEKAEKLDTCDHCGNHFLYGGGVLCVNKNLCNKCEKYLDQYKTEYYENLLNQDCYYTRELKESVDLLNTELLRRELTINGIQTKATPDGIHLIIDDFKMPKYWNKKKIKLILEAPQPGWTPEYFQIPESLQPKNGYINSGYCYSYKNNMKRWKVNVQKWGHHDNLLTFFHLIHLRFQNPHGYNLPTTYFDDD